MLDEICSSLTGQDDLQVLSGDALAIRVIVENVARSWSPEMVAAIKAKVVEFRKYVKHLDWFGKCERIQLYNRIAGLENNE